VALKVGGKLLPGQLSSEPKNVCLMATQLSREPFVTCQWQSRVFTCSVEIKLSKSKFGFLSQQTHEILDAFTEPCFGAFTKLDNFGFPTCPPTESKPLHLLRLLDGLG